MNALKAILSHRDAANDKNKNWTFCTFNPPIKNKNLYQFSQLRQIFCETAAASLDSQGEVCVHCCVEIMKMVLCS